MSVKTIVYVVCFLAAGYFAFIFGTQWHNYMHPMDMSMISKDSLTPNMYVKCDIGVYLGEEECCEYIVGLYDYHYYDVLLYDGNYLRVGVYDLGLYDRLQGMGNNGDVVSFVGKVVKRNLTANEERYEPLGVSTGRVISSYCIEQTVDGAAMNKCLICLFAAVVSLFGFIGSFKVRYYGEEILDSNEASGSENAKSGQGKKEKPKYQNLDYELEVAKKRIDRIQHEIEHHRRLLVPGIALLIVGVFLIFFAGRDYIILGAVVILYGLIKIWKVFLHSGSKLAVTFSEVFSIDTLYRQLKRAEAKKSEIETLLCEKNSSDEKKLTAMGRVKDKATIIDCGSYSDAFMIPVKSDTLYGIKYGEGDVANFKIVTDEFFKEEQYLQWGNKKKDLSRVLAQAGRDFFFIHFEDVDALWMIANDEDYSVAPVSIFRLYSNGNISQDNINIGLEYREGEVLNPKRLRLRRAIYCLGPVVTTAEYYLNNLAKPQMIDDGNKYYYIDEEYVRENFAINTDIRAWQVPAQEEDIDKSISTCPIVEVPRGTRFTRMRVPRRAAHSYIDLYLENDTIIRVMEEHRTEDKETLQIMLDAEKKQFSYVEV